MLGVYLSIEYNHRCILTKKTSVSGPGFANIKRIIEPNPNQLAPSSYVFVLCTKCQSPPLIAAKEGKRNALGTHSISFVTS
jgi:hypothetical protein